jgi:hypothetical protein
MKSNQKYQQELKKDERNRWVGTVLQLHKVKEKKLKGHQKILEEIEIHL